MEERITITVKSFGIIHTSELYEDVSAEQFIETCCKMALSLSYSGEQVRQGLRQALEMRE